MYSFIKRMFLKQELQLCCSLLSFLAFHGISLEADEEAIDSALKCSIKHTENYVKFKISVYTVLKVPHPLHPFPPLIPLLTLHTDSLTLYKEVSLVRSVLIFRYNLQVLSAKLKCKVLRHKSINLRRLDILRYQTQAFIFLFSKVVYCIGMIK